jgi:hypothetical protein
LVLAIWNDRQDSDLILREFLFLLTERNFLTGGDFQQIRVFACQAVLQFPHCNFDTQNTMFKSLSTLIMDPTRTAALLESQQFLSLYVFLFSHAQFMKRAIALIFDAIQASAIDPWRTVTRFLAVQLSSLDSARGWAFLDCFLDSAPASLIAPYFAFLKPEFVRLLCTVRSQALAYKIMQFLTALAEVAPLTGVERMTLVAALRALEGGAPSDACFGALVSLAAGRWLAPPSPAFTVVQPKGLPLVVLLFWESPRLLADVRFLEALCRFAAVNFLRADEGGLDPALLDDIDAHVDAAPSLTALFSVLEAIGAMASSVAVVGRSLSLLCPVSARFRSPALLPAVAALNRIVLARQSQPRGSLALSGESPSVEIDGVPAELLWHGLTSTLRLRVDDGARESTATLLTPFARDAAVVALDLGCGFLASPTPGCTRSTCRSPPATGRSSRSRCAARITARSRPPRSSTAASATASSAGPVIWAGGLRGAARSGGELIDSGPRLQSPPPHSAPRLGETLRSLSVTLPRLLPPSRSPRHGRRDDHPVLQDVGLFPVFASLGALLRMCCVHRGLFHLHARLPRKGTTKRAPSSSRRSRQAPSTRAMNSQCFPLCSSRCAAPTPSAHS